MTEIEARIDRLEAQAKHRIAFVKTLLDGKRRFIGPGLQMQASYPSQLSIKVLLHRKRQKLTPADVTLVRRRLESHGWTLETEYKGEGLWEGTFVWVGGKSDD